MNVRSRSRARHFGLWRSRICHVTNSYQTVVYKLGGEFLARQQGSAEQWSQAHCQNSNPQLLPIPNNVGSVRIDTDVTVIGKIGIDPLIEGKPQCANDIER